MLNNKPSYAARITTPLRHARHAKGSLALCSALMVKRNDSARSPFSTAALRNQVHPQLHLGLPAHFSVGRRNWRADKVQVPGTGTRTVLQKRWEVKLREGRSRPGLVHVEGKSTGGHLRIWQMLPYCWKQDMDKILHVHSFSHISGNPRTLSSRAYLLKTWYQRLVFLQPLWCCLVLSK